VLTSAECRMKAKEKLTLAARERDRRRAKRVMSAANAWLILARAMEQHATVGSATSALDVNARRKCHGWPFSIFGYYAKFYESPSCNLLRIPLTARHNVDDALGEDFSHERGLPRLG
jgi:hypothetical protein